MKLKNQVRQVLGLGVLVGFAACESQDHLPKSQSVDSSKTWTRSVLQVQSSSAEELRTSPGRVVSVEQVQVASRMMGFVTQVLVSEGQTVEKGQVLFRIDPVDVEGQVALASAGGSQAKALLADARADFERFDRLYKDSAVTKAQWEKMKLNLEIALERVKSADAGLHMANAQKRYTDVVAPISGIVSQKMIQQGNLALPGHPLVVLENPEKLEIVTQVSADLYPLIHSQDQACLTYNGNKNCQSKITHRVETADPMSQTHLLKLSVPESFSMTAGAYVEVGFVQGTQTQIQIPNSALTVRAGIPGVLVLDQDSRAHFRMVRSVPEAGDRQVIQAGLSQGEKIVLMGLDSIAEGDLIQSEVKHAE